MSLTTILLIIHKRRGLISLERGNSALEHGFRLLGCACLAGRDAFIGYSPYVRPMMIGGVKCVLVDERLRDIERMAFDFVMNFAQDNDLPVYEGCVLPERSPDPAR